MQESAPKIAISDSQPLDTAMLREHEVFTTADPASEVPDVHLTSAPLDPADRTHPNATRVGINDVDGNAVGAFNLVQKRERNWINGVSIERRQGERLAISSYLGVIAALHTVGRSLESDPQGLSPDSTHVWESLVRRGVAQRVDGIDQHGHPKFKSTPSPLH